uniref:Uncharacterized protein n=1 Tax=Tanacetum cinerariifolium TaxID=118510 RepID=A0A6L2LJW7_TANCI|nr:hypothetical protein [Tanacetum cinerariifolium]
MDRFGLFEDVIMKMIDYCLSNVVVDFHRWVFLLYPLVKDNLLVLYGVDEDLTNLAKDKRLKTSHWNMISFVSLEILGTLEISSNSLMSLTNSSKTTGAYKGTDTIPRDPDVPIYKSESKKESWGDSEGEDKDDKNDAKDKSDGNNDDAYDDDDANNDDDANDDDNQVGDDTNDDVEQTDSDRTESDRIKILVLNQSSTKFYEEEEEKINDEETMDKEEDDKVTKELYDDVNVNLGKEDTKMTNDDQGALEQQIVSQESRFEKVKEDAHVTLTLVLNTQKANEPVQISAFANLVIERNVIESLEAVVLARPSSQPMSMYEAAVSLFEFELTKILLDKIEEKEPSYTDEDSGMQQDQEFVTRDNDVQPADKETWISQVARAKEPRTSFDELMDTSFDFSASVINRLTIKDLTQEILVGTAFELLKGKPYSFDLSKPLPLIQDHRGHHVIPQDFFINNDLEYLKGGDLSRRSMYDHLEEIEVRREDQKLYKFREGDFLRLRLQDIEDMLLLLVQQKLTNLTIDERYALNVALRMFTRRIVIQRRVEDLQLRVKSYQKKLNLTKPDTFMSNLRNRTTYTAYSHPKGVIYKDQININRLMRADKLHKFSDGTLDNVRSALNDIAKGIRVEYLPKRKWRNLDK